MELKKRILIAPLNWGLGHATRCIPIINALIDNNFTPILASDGIALELLKKEFPGVKTIDLPPYNITYSKKGGGFKTKLIMDSSKMLKAIKGEKIIIKKLVKDKEIDGIISDNRLGVFNRNVPTVFVSHQLNVLSGSTSWFSSKIHQTIIKKFNECWVPDVELETNLSGKLGHLQRTDLNLRYIGPLSRFTKVDSVIKYDLMVLLSGPEPQRTIFEEIIIKKLNDYKGSVVIVKGKVEDKQIKSRQGNIIIYNFMTSQDLERTINQSSMVLSRSGYTTIMDLAKLEKKAFFIPTPGQYEQEYLANKLDGLRLVPTCYQDNFKIEMLDSIKHFKGLQSINYEVDFKDLFSLFQSERKLTANA